MICEFGHEFGVSGPVLLEPFVMAFADLVCDAGDGGHSCRDEERWKGTRQS